MKLFCIVASTFLLSSSVWANFDSYEVEMMNMEDPIYVSGKQRQRKLTAAQKMKLMRQQREQQNELYAKKKIEQWRLQQEIEMTKRIKKIFDAQLKALDNI